MEPHGLHRDAGRPGRLGQRLPDSTGAAFGTLSTLAVLPWPASNGVGDLSNELAYARANSSFTSVQLTPGTEPFRPDLAGAIPAPGG